MIVETSGNISEELKKITLKDVVFELAEGWQPVKAGLIKSSWRQLLPASMLHPWEDEDLVPLSTLAQTIRSESTETEMAEIINLTKQLSDMSREEVEKWALGDEDAIEMMNEDDILQNIENLEAEEEESEEETRSRYITHGEAVTSFNKCIEWAKNNGEESCHILLLEQMQKRAKVLERNALSQRKITSFFKK